MVGPDDPTIFVFAKKVFTMKQELMQVSPLETTNHELNGRIYLCE